MIMRFLLFSVFLLILAAGNVFGQTSMTSSGDWATAANWSGSNIADVVTETVSIGNNVNPTVNNGTSLTVGTTTLNNNNSLTIASGGTLNIGDAAHANNLITTNNNTTITVAGTLVIWGSLQVNNNVVWNITGTVIIKGDVNLANNAQLDVSGGGTLQVGGSFSGGNNTIITVPSGSITVGGTTSVGNGSTLSGCTGCFHGGGTCTGPSGFCSGSTMPITLVSFDGASNGAVVTLQWSTASELNFDRFVVERLTGHDTFGEIGFVPGHGTSNQLIEYSYEDRAPIAGSNYYRLRSVDYDGTFATSEVIKVDFTKTDDQVTLYPNPVTGGVFNVLTTFPHEQGDRIKIYNNVGLLVGERQIDANDTSVGESLTSGIYTLWYVSGSRNCMVRFAVK
jgi:hypothetical protein